MVSELSTSRVMVFPVSCQSKRTRSGTPKSRTITPFARAPQATQHPLHPPTASEASKWASRGGASPSSQRFAWMVGLLRSRSRTKFIARDSCLPHGPESCSEWPQEKKRKRLNHGGDPYVRISSPAGYALGGGRRHACRRRTAPPAWCRGRRCGPVEEDPGAGLACRGLPPLSGPTAARA